MQEYLRPSLRLKKRLQSDPGPHPLYKHLEGVPSERAAMLVFGKIFNLSQ